MKSSKKAYQLERPRRLQLCLELEQKEKLLFGETEAVCPCTATVLSRDRRPHSPQAHSEQARFRPPVLGEGFGDRGVRAYRVWRRGAGLPGGIRPRPGAVRRRRQQEVERVLQDELFGDLAVEARVPQPLQVEVHLSLRKAHTHTHISHDQF